MVFLLDTVCRGWVFERNLGIAGQIDTVAGSKDTGLAVPQTIRISN